MLDMSIVSAKDDFKNVDGLRVIEFLISLKTKRLSAIIRLTQDTKRIKPFDHYLKTYPNLASRALVVPEISSILKNLVPPDLVAATSEAAAVIVIAPA